MERDNDGILATFNSHLKIRNWLTSFCYGLIAVGLFVYVYFSISESKTVRLVSKFKNNSRQYQTEKVMINPRINFQHNDNEVYQIKAKKAFHQSDQEVTMYDVFATGSVGTITAGELKVDEEGNHLTFSHNPVLILNEVKK